MAGGSSSPVVTPPTARRGQTSLAFHRGKSLQAISARTTFLYTHAPVQVSVIIPTFNRRELVCEAIRSVLAQRLTAPTDVEVIVVDDGSTDGTVDCLRATFGQDIRLEALRENRGVAAARNAGASIARGTWLAFLDSDDLWKPQKLAFHLAFAERYAFAISQTEEVWIRQGRFVNPCRYHRKPEGDIFLASLERCLVSPSAVLIHRDLWARHGGFDPSLPACEDYDLWLRIACEEPVGLLRKPLVIKRGGHDDQLSRRFWGMDRFRVASLLRVLFTCPLDARRAHAVLRVLERKCAILANGAAKRHRFEEAERYRAVATAARDYVEERWPVSSSRGAAA
ncbi:MAG: glycosyl transferase [Candidatus Binatia bacterium]|nr:MAG: glycosyl transferase [Candidatus Binatia bacterium]